MNVSLNDKIAGRDHYDRALKLREEIARQNPDHDRAKRDVLLSYRRLGVFHLLQLSDPAAARDFFQKALDEFERRFEAEPASVIAREDLAMTEYYFATAALRIGDRESAALQYKACLAIREGLGGDPKAKLDINDLMIIRARLRLARDRLEDGPGIDHAQPRTTLGSIFRPPVASRHVRGHHGRSPPRPAPRQRPSPRAIPRTPSSRCAWP